MMMHTMRKLVVVAVSLGAVSTAWAVDDVITFDEVAPGTAINDVTLLGYATFMSQIQAFDSPTVEVEGVPDDGEYGEGAFLVGDVGDFVRIQLAIPVTRVAVDFALNDTVHSSAQMHLQAFGAHGQQLAFVQGFALEQATWPASQGDSFSGHVEVEGVGEIYSVGLSFAGTALATMFAYDNIEFTRAGCSIADVAAPFGTLDFSDVVEFLTLFSNENELADLAAPFGQFDFSDVVEYLARFAGGCP
ncbi:MAG: GC-type dockerin domain-anchored protein [Phycisphaerales bacterium]